MSVSVLPEPRTHAEPALPPRRSGGAQHRAPLVAALRAALAPPQRRFHCPGHKGGSTVDAELRDILGDGPFMADVWLPTADYATALGAAQDLAAQAFGADQAFLVGAGSSGSNLALLLGILRPGDEVLVARDAHTSTLAAITLAGAHPLFLTPRMHPTLGLGLPLDAADLADALHSHPGVRLVSVVTPSYYGVVSDVAALARVAHAHDIPLHVDQAWGAHLGFHPDLPASATAAGADAVVTSTHKMLSSLSQGSLLLLRGARIESAKVEQALTMTRTTSPYLPLLASIDGARRTVATHGAELLGTAISLATSARALLADTTGIRLVGANSLGLPDSAIDPLKLVIDVSGLGLTGVGAEKLLRAGRGLMVEGSDRRHVICVVTMGDTEQSISELTSGFAWLAAGARDRRAPAIATVPDIDVLGGDLALAPRDALHARWTPIPLQRAAGRISAEAVTPYPPGIPVLVPGERVTLAKIAHLQALVSDGVHLHGCVDSSLVTLRVVDVDADDIDSS